MGKIRRARTKRHIEAVKNSTSEETSKSTQFLPNEVLCISYLPYNYLPWYLYGTAFYNFYVLSFQSSLPALFPINNLFKVAQENSKNDKFDSGAEKSGEIDNEEKLTTKKDKRKLRHEKFLKSEDTIGLNLHLP